MSIEYHKRHEAYMSAVADALAAAGFEVLDWHADPNDPRDGAIEIKPVGAWDGYEEVWIGWQEERRWYAVPYDDGDAAMVAPLTFMDAPIATVAAPSSVVDAVVRLLGLDWAYTPAPGEPDEFDAPGHYFEDDNPGLEAALLRYAEA